MITKDDFAIIDANIKEGLREAFDFIKINSSEHDYVLFLAEGEFLEYLKESYLKLNPYTIGNQGDKIKEESRVNFFIRFMELFYSFPVAEPISEDNEFKLTMELMIYTHIWESKPYLKQLFRLASLVNKELYHWNVDVPDNPKHEFIRKNIKSVFNNYNLQIGKIIEKGYNSSLRNAFAHSEYQINNYSKTIILDNFKEKDKAWALKEISFDDWTKRFAYSALLSYHLINEKVRRRKSIINDFGKDRFLIVHPITKTKSKTCTIHYDYEFDRFEFL